MRTRFTLFVAGLFALGCGGSDQAEMEEAPPAAAEAASPSAADEAALDAFRQSYVEHYNMHHADVIAGMYADSAMGVWANGTITSGRAAVEAYNAAQFAEGNPQLNLTTAATQVLGDHAVTRGTWSVQATAEGGEPVTQAGEYLTVFGREGDAWKIDAVVTNFTAEPPADMEYVPWPAETPADEGTMKEFVAAWQSAYNAGDFATVASMYAPDAHVAFSNTPPVTGPAALEALLNERSAEGASTVEIHDVYTEDLGGGWFVDFGWYRLTPAAGTARDGVYASLSEVQADGTRKIHWHISNGQPAN